MGENVIFKKGKGKNVLIARKKKIILMLFSIFFGQITIIFAKF